MKNLLPIGSIIKVSDIDKKLMIYGRIQKNIKNGKETIYDYIACIYPEGNISASKAFLFNHQQIEKVYFIGYQDSEELSYRKIIINTLNEQ